MAADVFRITLAQLNPTVGDIAGNAAKAREARAKAAADGADVVVLPELFIAGYPPGELLREPDFQAACRAAVEALARETADGGPAVLIGTPWAEDGKLYDAVALLDAGRISATRFKTNLPDDDAFEHKHLFARGPAAGPLSVRGRRIGVAIGEDLGAEEVAGYENVVETLAETGAEFIVVPSGSRHARGHGDRRLSLAVARVIESGLPLVYLNLIGGQNERVFDGASFALNADVSLAAQLPAFAEQITTLAIERDDDGWHSGPVASLPEGDEADYMARVLGLRDRVAKSRFDGIVLGLTADIESALSLAMAVDALGPAGVRGVVLSGPDTQAQDEVIAAAARLGVVAEVVPIAAAVAGFESILAAKLSHSAHRDLLAGVRATLLKALASLSGALALLPQQESSRRGDDIEPAQLIRLAALRNRWRPVDALGAAGEVIPPDLIDRAASGAVQG
ncbi:NAD+ synthase [Bradyrhizobium sp. SSBR45G]|uniref:nitrilase-related carbon-nitrogen hydrolase n=1 Tax=unclassified Bradyrhizobium TaxID=2631580 RepID=UPI002342A799|nr:MULTISPECIES: nitrilase-related carbon-nitrogen hydrolase [unclassified Bradyrhizobium]GLH76168.1 NAD+ synthase [Bradyrhizobium sp. SSBR45G]GLH83348.1 NAD+ synthase [Bradyrhizobium sp. SSBR45R]